jgi:hypothetical protein
MFGSFTEESLSRYAELAGQKEKKPAFFDNLGIGDVDHSHLDEEKAAKKRNGKQHDYTECLRVGQ